MVHMTEQQFNAIFGGNVVNDDGITFYDIGDIVMLASGGPHMTVVDVCDECDAGEVAWFDGDALCGEVFPTDALVEAE